MIEPRIKDQWYIDCDNMATKAIEVLFLMTVSNAVTHGFDETEYFTQS